MDRNSALRCLKFSLVAGNAAVIALGLAGFITGLLAPMAMTHLGVSGSQLALVSCTAIVIALAGLIGALREHFCLLATYALCIFSVFIFRLIWSLTTPLHLSGPFAMDTTVSLTLLSSLATLFLMIFAILLALTLKNSLPITRKKFLYLKDKLKMRRKKKKSKDKIDSSRSLKAKSRLKNYATMMDLNGIYSSNHHNHHRHTHPHPGYIYESSSRRKSPLNLMQPNGHHHNRHQNSQYGSNRSRRGVGYSGPTYSLNESAQSSTSQDSNNNQKHQNSTKLYVDTNLQSVRNNQKAQSQSLPRSGIGPKRGQKIYSSSSDYIHYRSPSPPKTVSTILNKEKPISKQKSKKEVTKIETKFTNQPFFNPYRSLPKNVAKNIPTTIANVSTIGIETPTKRSFESEDKIVEKLTAQNLSPNESYGKNFIAPRSILYSPNTTPNQSSNRADTKPLPYEMDWKNFPSSNQQKQNLYNYELKGRDGDIKISLSIPTSTSSSSRLYSSQPNVLYTGASGKDFRSKIDSTQTLMSTASSRTSIFTTPLYSSSYQFDGGHLFDSSYGTRPYNNLVQARNLFSNPPSPLTSSQISSNTSISNERILSPFQSVSSNYHSTSLLTPSSSKNKLSSNFKSPVPSPTNINLYNRTETITPSSSSSSASSILMSQKSYTPTTIIASKGSITSTRYVPSKLFSSISSIKSPFASSSPISPPSSSSSSSSFNSGSEQTTVTATIASSFVGDLTSPTINNSNRITIFDRPYNVSSPHSTTISNDRYNFFQTNTQSNFTSTTMTSLTSTTISTNTSFFSRVYPKTYEEYVKSYRYPEPSSSSTTTTTTITTPTSSSISTSLMATTTSTITSTTTKTRTVYSLLSSSSIGYNNSSNLNDKNDRWYPSSSSSSSMTIVSRQQQHQQPNQDNKAIWTIEKTATKPSENVFVVTGYKSNF
ncbi:hypothetical protein SSS_10544 [Sarcoptes scabiei]|uniref:Uncharacterized protein n=2 Tax=Sarcoptes scabiei TaxID=52283 RepID=A0A834V9P3_SARSC|nr:hypothetical protein SSS_10544 [Sarcoptes scabiei]